MQSLRITMAVLTLLLCLFHLTILVSFSSILALQGIRPDWPVFLYWLSIAIGGVYALGTLIVAGLRRNTLVAWINGFISAALAASLLWYLVDAPALTDDYTEQALRYPANGSYELLQTFNDDHFTQQAKSSLKEGQVLKAWDEITTYRAAIKALDERDAICDLPDAKPIDVRTPFLKYSAMRDVAEIYHGYCLYQVAAGHGPDAARELARLHRISRKGMTQASVVINKLIFTAIAKNTLKSAHAMLRHEQCDHETLQRLQNGFTPMKPEEYTMARAFIGEYLMVKNTMAQQISPDNFLSSVLLGSNDAEPIPVLSSLVSRPAYYFGFKPNKSLRDVRQAFDLLINSQKKHPPDFSAALQFADDYARKPQLRNMAGWILNSIALPSFESYSRRSVEIKVQSDLLAVALSRKLNRPPEVKDYFTGGDYRFRQEGAELRHPGQDGDYDTPDDIVLGANSK